MYDDREEFSKPGYKKPAIRAWMAVDGEGDPGEISNAIKWAELELSILRSRIRSRLTEEEHEQLYDVWWLLVALMRACGGDTPTRIEFKRRKNQKNMRIRIKAGWIVAIEKAAGRRYKQAVGKAVEMTGLGRTEVAAAYRAHRQWIAEAPAQWERYLAEKRRLFGD